MTWQKYITRRIAVQVALAWNHGFGEAMERTYGLSVRHTLVYRDPQKTEYYTDRAEFARYVDGLYAKLRDETFLRSFHQEARSTLEQILADTTASLDDDLTSWSNDELAAWYRSFLPTVADFYVRMWTVFNIGEPLANTVRQELAKTLKEPELTEALLKFSSPLEPNDVLNERRELLILARNRSKLREAEVATRLAEHTKRYRHIPMFDFDHEPYTIDHFRRELAAITDPKRELAEMDELFVNRRHEFNAALSELQPSPYLRLLLTYLSDAVFLRDYRDMLRQKLNLVIRSFYLEVAQRFHWTITEIASLTNDEMLAALEHGSIVSKAELAARAEYFLLTQHDSTVTIVSGEAAREFAERELHAAATTTNEVHGITGAPGKASGRAVVIYTNRDLAKVEPGDILIATMTRQDFVPVMRRAAAVVTDEGSVTAHAAIICRELGIPCIVATKTGTQTFRDGDRVEVDATTGIARRISQREE